MHVITTMGPAGAETMLCRIAAGMDPSRFENKIVSLTGILDLAQKMQGIGVNVRTLGMKKNIPNPLLIMRLARWIRESKPDVIHAWMYHANLVAALAARTAGNVPVVWGIHHNSLDPNVDKRRTLLVNRACSFLSKRLPARIVCCSEASLQLHRSLGYAPEKLEVIPNGVDLQHLKPDSSARNSVRKELGIPVESPVIGIAARFHPHKDHRNFIRAAARLHQQRADVHFVLCGMGITWQNVELSSWIEAMGLRNRFHLLGPREDVPRLFSAMDMACTSSRSEAFPVTICEAMACGTPCVVTDVGDSAMIVGETGVVVPARDPAALAEGWRKLLDAGLDERRRLGMAARERVERHFALPNIVERYQAIYSDLVPGAPQATPASSISSVPSCKRIAIASERKEVMLKSAERARETMTVGKGNPTEPVKTARSPRPGMAVILNSSIAVGFLEGQLEYFQQHGFDVALLCPERRENEWQVPPPTGIPIVEVPMEREVAPLQDFATLAQLWRTMRSLQPSVTNVGTPKAGLLGGLAAWLNRVPCRFYTLHGLRFETTRGLKRRLLLLAERLACLLAHRVVCVSHSVREKAIAAGLAPKGKMIVFGAGSCNGIDAARFAPNPKLIQRATALRRQLGIPERATILLFLGRLTSDKGIPELVAAFSRLEKRFPDLRLLLAGCLEAGDPLPSETRRQMAANPNIIFAGPVQDTPCYYAAADVVVLPSHREGLPTVVLEAQAAGRPVVGANVTGIVDMVVDGETGLLFPIGDVAALAATIERLLTDKALSRRLESNGQERVRREFRQERIWDALYREYLEVLRNRERPLPLAHKAQAQNLGS